MISPTTIASEANDITYIGVDERLAAIDSDGHVVFSMPLPSQLFTVQNAGSLTIAICELQAIVFGADGVTKSIIEFPDVLEDFSVEKEALFVSFLDGGSRYYTYETNWQLQSK